MKKISKALNATNLMLIAGLGLVIFGIGSIVYQYIQDNSVVVLSDNGGSGGDPNAFKPPLQALVTSVPEQATKVTAGIVQTPQPTLQDLGKIPDRLVIHAIDLDAPVLPEHYKEITLDGEVFVQWRVPFRRASGWQDTTALLGDVGNTVLNGHHNEFGEVFKDLINIKEGDLVEVYSGQTVFTYKVSLIMLLPEKYQSLDERIKNASWIMPTTDERLTMVTCWPPDNNTHRLIVVAFPVKG